MAKIQTHACRVFIPSRPMRIAGVLLLLFTAVLRAQQPAVPQNELQRIIEEERKRREAAMAALPANNGTNENQAFAELIQENVVVARLRIQQSAQKEKDGDLNGAAALLEEALDRFDRDKVAEFVPAEVIGAVATNLSRVRLGQATQAIKQKEFKPALILVEMLLAALPEAESMGIYRAKAADFRRQVEKAEADYLARTPSHDTRARLSELSSRKQSVEKMLLDGRFLYEARELDEADELFREVAKLDPRNDQAYHYLHLIQKIRSQDAELRRQQSFIDRVEQVNKAWLPPYKQKSLPIPNPYYRGKSGMDAAPQSGMGRSSIMQKLQSIRVPEIKPLDGFAMAEVVDMLDAAVRAADPDKQGVNFQIKTLLPKQDGDALIAPGALFLPNPNAPAPKVNPKNGLPIMPDFGESESGVPSAGSVGPAKPATTTTLGAPALLPARPIVPLGSNANAFNPSQVKIRGMTTSLRSLTVLQLLDAITTSFDIPVKYEVIEYAVVLSFKEAEAEKLYTKTFNINPNAFKQGLNLPGNFPSARASGLPPVEPPSAFGQLPGLFKAGQSPVSDEPVGVGSQFNKTQSGKDDRIYYGVPGGGGGAPGGGGGAPGGGGAAGGGGALNNTAAAQAVMAYLQAQGINVTQVFFNDRRGILMVRAPLADLELVEQAIEILNASPPQVMIEAKFTEVAFDDNNALGFDWYLGSFGALGQKMITDVGTAPTYIGKPSTYNPSGFFPFPGTLQQDQFVPSQFSILPKETDGRLTHDFKQHGNPLLTLTGILTKPQFRMVLTAMDKQEGADVLSQPKIITVSGRQAQIDARTQEYLVTGVQPSITPGMGGGFGGVGGMGGGVMMPTVTQAQFGPVLDVIPYVGADGFTIEMNIRPQFTEFLGYEDTSFEATAFAGGTVVRQPLALPRIRTRQLDVQCVVWDGQTLMLGGLISESVNTTKDKVPFLGDVPFVGRLFRGESTTRKKKNMTIFVTPTIVDPAGNAVNAEETLPFMRQPQNEVPGPIGLQP